MISGKPEFWGKKDVTSMARSLRLAVIHQQYISGNIDKEEAEELLDGPLEPENPETIYKDSVWLVWACSQEKYEVMK